MTDLVLRILHHNGTQEVKDLVQGHLTIGRGPDNWLSPVDPALSRRHAVIHSSSNELTIEDLNTRNGTHVNNDRISTATVLAPGDIVDVGSTRISVTVAGESTESRRVQSTIEIDFENHKSRIVAQSPQMRDLIEQADRFAHSTLPVLITGETGTGKELLAERIHLESPQRHGPFIILNCPALAPGLVESELFGVEGGVATDVVARTGRLEAADKGTLFLDEVADLGLEVQAKLLRFLQDGTIEAVGGRSAKTIEVRLLAATNQDLESAIDAGLFRRDLFYRIAAVSLDIPPLRNRPEDIPFLVEYLLKRRNLAHVRVEKSALAAMEEYEFPGNVRELDAMVSRAAALADEDVIHLCNLALGPPKADSLRTNAWDSTSTLDAVAGGHADFWESVHRPFIERELSRPAVREFVERGLERSGGSVKGLAKLLGEEHNYRKLLDFLRNNRLLP